jgi:hypothetical protein
MNSQALKLNAYLVVAFSRPQHTFEIVSFLISKGLKVYLFVDKSDGVNLLNEQVIQIATEFMSHSNFSLMISDAALGPQRGVETAIDWAFGTEEVLVVLEDDAVISNSGITYFENALSYLTEKVVIISSRALPYSGNFDYCLKSSHLSSFALTNSWMTTRSFWHNHYKGKTSYFGIFGARLEGIGFLRTWLTRIFFITGRGRFELGIGKVGWDQKVVFTLLRDGLSSFVPNRTVTGNRGVDQVASNTTNNSLGDNFLYHADFQDPNLIVCSNEACQQGISREFYKLYGIRNRHLLAPLKLAVEIVFQICRKLVGFQFMRG